MTISTWLIEKLSNIHLSTGNIKAMELVMVDPGTVIGPNYSSKPICIECLHPGKIPQINNMISIEMAWNTYTSI